MSRKPINKTIKKNKKKFTRRKRNMKHVKHAKHVNKMQSRKRRGGNNRTKRGGKGEIELPLIPNNPDSRPGTPDNESSLVSEGDSKKEPKLDKLVAQNMKIIEDLNSKTKEIRDILKDQDKFNNLLLADRENPYEQSKFKYQSYTDDLDKNLKLAAEEYEKERAELKERVTKRLKYRKKILEEVRDSKFDKFYIKHEKDFKVQYPKYQNIGKDNSIKKQINDIIDNLQDKINRKKKETAAANTLQEAAKRKAKEEEDAKKAELKRQEDAEAQKSKQLTVSNSRAPVTNNKTSSNNALTVPTEVKSDSQPKPPEQQLIVYKKSPTIKQSIAKTQPELLAKTSKKQIGKICNARKWVDGTNTFNNYDCSGQFIKDAKVLHPDKFNQDCLPEATILFQKLRNICPNGRHTQQTQQQKKQRQISKFNTDLNNGSVNVELTKEGRVEIDKINRKNQKLITVSGEDKTNRPRLTNLLKSAQGELEKKVKSNESTNSNNKLIPKETQGNQVSKINAKRVLVDPDYVFSDEDDDNDEPIVEPIDEPFDEKTVEFVKNPRDPNCKSLWVDRPNFDKKDVCKDYVTFQQSFHPDFNKNCEEEDKKKAEEIWDKLQKKCIDVPLELSDVFKSINNELQNITNNSNNFKDIIDKLKNRLDDVKNIFQQASLSNAVVDIQRILEDLLSKLQNQDTDIDINEFIGFLNENETTYIVDEDKKLVEAKTRKLEISDGKYVSLPLYNGEPLFRFDKPIKSKVYPKYQLILPYNNLIYKAGINTQDPDNTDEEFLFARYNNKGFVDKKNIYDYQITDFLNKLENTRKYIKKEFVDKKEELKKIQKDDEETYNYLYDKNKLEETNQNGGSIKGMKETVAKVAETAAKAVKKTVAKVAEKADNTGKQALRLVKGTLQEQINKKKNIIENTARQILSYERYNKIIESINPKLDEYETILKTLTDTDKLHSYLEYIYENQDKVPSFFNPIRKFKDSNHIMSIDDKVPLFRIGSPNPIHKLQFQIPEEVFNAIKNKHYSKTNKLVERLINAPILVSEEELKEVHENDIRESIEAVYQVHHTKDEGDKTDGIKIYNYISAIRALRNAYNNPKYKNTQLSKSLEKLREQMGGELKALDDKSTDLPYVKPDGNEFDFVEKKLISMYAPRTSENINEYDKSGFLGFLKREPIGQEAVEEKGDDELKEVVDPNTEEPSMDVKEIYQDKCRENISKEKRILGVFDENCIFSEQRPRLYQKAPIIILKRKLRKALSELSKKGDNKIIEIKDVLFPVKGLLKVGNYKNLEEQTPEEFLEKLKVNKFFKQKTSATEKKLLTQELTTRNKAGKLRVTLKKYKKFIADLLNNNITIGGAKKNYIANKIKDVEYNLNNGSNDKLNNELTAYMRNVANVSYDVNEKSKHIQKCFVDIGNPDAYNILGIVGDINGLNCLLQNKESFEFIESPVITITKKEIEGL